MATIEQDRNIMNINPTPVNHLLTSDEGVERRSKPRIYDPFPVVVRGVDASGETFEFKTVIDNISAGGLYLRLTRCVEPGVMLSIYIRLSTTPKDDVPAPHVAVHGVVLRAEQKPSGACGVAVAFTNHRFL